MRILALTDYAVSISITTALLAACGGSQPPIGTPGATAQTSVRHRTYELCTGSFSGILRPQVFTRSGTRRDTPEGLSPADLQSAYDLPFKTKGKGQIVAIVELCDNPNVAADLAEYRSTFGLP